MSTKPSATYKKHLGVIATSLRTAKTPKALAALLQDLITPQEAESVTERIAIFRLLNAGMTQREIAKKLKVSVTTVNRGSRMLQYGTGAAKKIR